MAITEKPSKIEFSWKGKDGQEIKLEYKDDAIYVDAGHLPSKYPVDLFVEVVDFLRDKRIISSSLSSRTPQS